MHKLHTRLAALILAVVLLFSTVPIVDAVTFTDGGVVKVYHESSPYYSGYYIASALLSGENIPAGAQWFYCLDQNHPAYTGDYKLTKLSETDYWKNKIAPDKTKSDGIIYALRYGCPNAWSGYNNIYGYRATQKIIWEYANGSRTSPATKQTLGSGNYKIDQAYKSILQEMSRHMTSPKFNTTSVALAQRGEINGVTITDSTGALGNDTWKIAAAPKGVHITQNGNSLKVWADDTAAQKSSGTVTIVRNMPNLTLQDGSALCAMVGTQQCITGVPNDPMTVSFQVSLDLGKQTYSMKKTSSAVDLSVEGYRFKFWHRNGSGAAVSQYAISDRDGSLYETNASWVKTSNNPPQLEAGTYTIKEVGTGIDEDYGYHIKPDFLWIKETQNGSTTNDRRYDAFSYDSADPGWKISNVQIKGNTGLGDYVLQFVIDNTYQTENLQIRKVDRSGNGNVAGIPFTVEEFVSGIGWCSVFTGSVFTTDSRGYLSIPLYVGAKYRITEADVENYEPEKKSQEITIKEGSNTLTFYNRAVTGNLALIKKDLSGEGKVSGIPFTVKNSAGRVVASGVSGWDGNLSITGLEPGTYTVTETVPDGYTCVENNQTVTIKAGETAVVTFENDRTKNLKIVKKDLSGKGKVSGISFTVTDKSGKTVGSGKTDAKGELTIPGLQIGESYTVKETVPTGYISSKNPQTITIQSSPDPNVIEFTNDEIRGSLEIVKYDSSTNRRIEGVGFRVFDSTGKKVAEGYTDADGAVEFNNLPYGKYTYQEFDAPAGFVLDTTSYSFSIQTDGQTIQATRQNAPEQGSIRIHKTDSSGKALLGVSFLLEYSTDGGKTYQPVTSRSASSPVTPGGCTSSGLKNGILVTDRNGDAVFSGLRVSTPDSLRGAMAAAANLEQTARTLKELAVIETAVHAPDVAYAAKTANVVASVEAPADVMPIASGGAVPIASGDPDGPFELTVNITDGNGNPVPGATLEARFHVEGNQRDYYPPETLTDNGNGQYVLRGKLADFMRYPGIDDCWSFTVTITQTAAPSGYEMATDTLTFEGDLAAWESSPNVPQTKSFDLVNKKQESSTGSSDLYELRVKLKDSSSSAALTGATFEAEINATWDGGPAAESVTLEEDPDEAGTYVLSAYIPGSESYGIKSLKSCHIVIREAIAPPGYDLSSITFSFDVDVSAYLSAWPNATTQKKTFNLTNTGSVVTYTVVLRDAITGKYLSGGGFATGGTALRETDTGIYSVQLPAGSNVSITQTKAPTGYVKSTETLTKDNMTYDAGTKTYSATVWLYPEGMAPTTSDGNATISVKLVDGNTGKLLTGGGFNATVTAPDGKQTTVALTETGTTGVYTVKVAGGSSVTITQTKAPAGYRISTGTLEFSKVTGGMTYNGTVANLPAPATLQVTLRDSQTNTLLRGGGFRVSVYRDGAFVESLNAAETTAGVYTVEIPVGTHCVIQQTVAPAGYRISRTQVTVDPTTAGATYEKTITNDPIPTGGSSGNDDGVILYRLTEVKTVDGYQLLTKPAFEGELTVDEEKDISLHVVNNRIGELPFTGGIGFRIALLASLLLGVAAGALFLLTRRRQEG